jgi:hypothetical protein
MESLVRPGLLSPWDGEHVPFLYEEGGGLVWSGPARDDFDASLPPDALAMLFRAPIVGAAHFGAVMGAARARVLAALRGLLAEPSDDSFVQAALDAGRVRRATNGEERDRWSVRLTPLAAMSEQVLALFAADLLEDRAAYDEALTVCDLCEVVGFDAEGLDVPRRRCTWHQDEP